ncbi:hypothetical protein [Micromonospora echinofusca]|uniref:Glucuronyl hydrolase n=1 Tax=Micromonospora echinofusca TaxID=47858 RepID=A0ABS3VPZ9_MICEH|nr:hypothetical protein [Micromonospora echinofusca]MBO4206626.1 glucuronyl hydrolase [Micromonospora echinofusca]
MTLDEARPAPTGRPAGALTTGEIGTALAHLTARVERIHRAAPEQVPLFADPATGEWTTSRRGSWVGGFWVGLLWLRATVTDDPTAAPAAAQWTVRLRDRLDDDTVTRAMTCWYGAALGVRLHDDPAATGLARLGAGVVARCYDPDLGAVPVGTAFGLGEVGRHRVSVDSAGALVRLLCWAADDGGDPRLRTVAARHLDRFTAGDPTGPVPVELDRDPATGALVDRHPGGSWARGEAWALLATVDAHLALGDGYRPAAQAAAERWLTRHGDRVPADRPERPDGLLDTAAAAIAGYALRKLGAVGLPDAERYASAADLLLARLVREHLGGSPGVDAPPGMLRGGCYEVRPGQRREVETVWGTFFLTAALATAAGRIHPTVL